MSNKKNIDDSLFTNNDNDIFASDGVFLDSKDIFNTNDKNVEIHPIKKETLPKIEENTPEIKAKRRKVPCNHRGPFSFLVSLSKTNALKRWQKYGIFHLDKSVTGHIIDLSIADKSSN